MTINDLLSSIVEGIVELLARIVLAFSRTFDLIGDGRLGSLVLQDIGIIVATAVVGLLVAGWMFSLSDETEHPAEWDNPDDE